MLFFGWHGHAVVSRESAYCSHIGLPVIEAAIMGRPMRGVILLFIALSFANPVGAQKAGSGNPVQDRLLALPPAEQTKAIAKNVGQGCVGVSAFPMGIANTDKWKSLAYWSIHCKDGRNFAIQIAPNAETFVIDCRVLQANGRECFKKF